MVCRTCGHGDNEHSFEEPCVCKLLSCYCVKFIQATAETPVFSEIDKYMEEFETIYDKMQWVLTNWKWFRNYTNKDLVIAWWKFVNGWDSKKQLLFDYIYKNLDEPESITRSRRKWVEKNPDLYGPYLPSNLQEHHILKQYAISEFMVEN